MEGAASGLAGKMEREEELACQPVRHSLWEQDSLEALNEVLLSCLDGEVEALLEVGSGSLTMEGVAMVAAHGGELEGVAQGPLQPVPGRKQQGEVGPLHPRGMAPKRSMDETIEQDGRGRQQ